MILGCWSSLKVCFLHSETFLGFMGHLSYFKSLCTALRPKSLKKNKQFITRKERMILLGNRRGVVQRQSSQERKVFFADMAQNFQLMLIRESRLSFGQFIFVLKSLKTTYTLKAYTQDNMLPAPPPSLVCHCREVCSEVIGCYIPNTHIINL